MYHHLGTSCEHSYYDSGGKVVLICHMILPEHMFKGLCEFMGEIPSQRDITFPCLVSIGLAEVKI